MKTNPPDETSLVRQTRLENLLQILARQGLSQNQVAQRTAVPASYLSDVKNGNRAMTELFARRLADEFHFDYRWILGEVGDMDPVEATQEVVEKESTSRWLALFPHPIHGVPQRQPDWDGASVEVCGVAAARARMALEPYVLHFLADDHLGQLRKHDLVLISQEVQDLAPIQVIHVPRGMYLARRNSQGQWERLAEAGPVKGKVEVTGHVVGIVWRSLG